MKYKIMKFAANKALEGKEIELKRVPEVSKPGKGKKIKPTIREILEEHSKLLVQIQQTLNQHTEILNLHTELFIEHGWLVRDPKTGKYVRPNEIK